MRNCLIVRGISIHSSNNFKILRYPFHNSLRHEFPSFLRLQEPEVIRIVIEEVLDEYCRAGGVAEDIERFFEVGVSVGEVGADPKVFEIFGGSFADAGGQLIDSGVALGSVAAPSARVHPFCAVSGGVGVNADQDDVFLAKRGAAGVYAAYALFERDVGEFRDDDFGVEAEEGEF